jgi:hypothetical protein
MPAPTALTPRLGQICTRAHRDSGPASILVNYIAETARHARVPGSRSGFGHSGYVVQLLSGVADSTGGNLRHDPIARDHCPKVCDNTSHSRGGVRFLSRDCKPNLHAFRGAPEGSCVPCDLRQFPKPIEGTRSEKRVGARSYPRVSLCSD